MVLLASEKQQLKASQSSCRSHNHLLTQDAPHKGHCLISLLHVYAQSFPYPYETLACRAVELVQHIVLNIHTDSELTRETGRLTCNGLEPLASYMYRSLNSARRRAYIRSHCLTCQLYHQSRVALCPSVPCEHLAESQTSTTWVS